MKDVCASPVGESASRYACGRGRYPTFAPDAGNRATRSPLTAVTNFPPRVVALVSAIATVGLSTAQMPAHGRGPGVRAGR